MPRSHPFAARPAILLAAAIVAAPAADAAVTIADESVRLETGVRIQTRATRADAEGATGGDWNLQTGTPGRNDPVDFSIRRSRLTAKGAYGSWTFNLTLQGDDFDRQNVGSPGVQVRYAWVDRRFELADQVSTSVHFGLDKPFFNQADFVSSSALLFPTNQVNQEKGLRNRSVGVGLRLAGPTFLIGADVQNVGGRPAGAVDPDEDEGYWTSARAEIGAVPEWFTAKRAESYVGKGGHAAVLGLEWGSERDRFLTATSQRTITSYGADFLFWYDSVTFIADWDRLSTTVDDFVAADPRRVRGDILSAQVGYAFTLGGREAVEPALRFARYDLDRDSGTAENFTAAPPAVGAASVEHGQSGTELEVGINWYLDGHGNKLQLAWTRWRPENGDARADIFRLQHQLSF